MKISKNFFKRLYLNPLMVYALSFNLVLLAYQLGWSKVYPKLSFNLLTFLGLTIFIATFFAIGINSKVLKIKDYTPGHLPLCTLFILITGFSLDLIYTGIPLYAALEGHPFNEKAIGIPTLHVFNVTFGSTFSTIRFSDYLYSKRLRYLIEAFIPFIFFLLILYRGPIILSLVSWYFVYLIKRHLTLKHFSILAAIGVVALYLFGILGNIREDNTPMPEHPKVEVLGRSTEEFQKSSIPKPYFWTYLYLTSSMANLQLITDSHFSTTTKIDELFLSEMLPDFISKRLLPLMNLKRVKTLEVSRGLNLATLYGRAYTLAGWSGATLLFIYLIMFILSYLALIRHSSYGVPCLALLNMLVMFCPFHNMIAFSGVILQLVWPLLLPTPQLIATLREKWKNLLSPDPLLLKEGTNK